MSADADSDTGDQGMAPAQSQGESLSHSRGKYQNLFGGATDAIFIMPVGDDGMPGKFIEVNDVACSRLGYTKDEFMSLSVSDINKPNSETGKNLPAIMAKLLADQFKITESVHITKDGREIPVEVSAHIFKLHRRKHILAIVRDISDRERKEEAIARFFSLPLDIMCIAGADGYFKKVNPAFVQTLGYSEGELLETPLMEFVHPDDRQATLDEVEKQLKGSATLDFRNRYICKDGSFRWLSWKAVAVEGGLLFASARDVTERESVEEALATAHKELESIMEANPDILYVINMRGELIRWNSGMEKFCGLSREEMLNRPATEFVCAEDRPTVLKGIQEVFNKGHFAIEARFIREDGVLVPFLCNGAVLKAASGEVIGFTGTGRDITEQKKSKEELRTAKENAEEATKLKDQFISLVSHDLRSPLANMIGMLNFLNSSENVKNDPAKRDEMVGGAIRSCTGLISLIDSLLDLSRLQTGNLRPVKKVVEAHSLVYITIFNLNYLAVEKGIKIVNDVPEGLHLFIDKALFSEVIKNIVSNAVKFCGAGNTVTISSAMSGGDTVLTIKDDGPGVREEFMPDIFKQEIKTSSLGSAGEAGTGLGLPYCHEIIEKHGGKLSVESAKGCGATFSIRLPEARIIILLVDDQPHYRKTMKEAILGFIEAEVLEAENGIEAMRILNDATPNLIITDIQMPEMDGFELLRRVKMNLGLADIPVVVSSSSSSYKRSGNYSSVANIRSRAFELGASDFVSKPLDSDDFIPRISRYLKLYFDWQDQYLVGVPHLDEQHQQLFQMVRSLQESLETVQTHNMGHRLLSDLIRFTETHFSDEEKFMKENGAPKQEYEEHLADHSDLIKQVKDFECEFEEKQKVVTPQIMSFLLDWIKNHVIRFDKKMAQYLKPAA